ncbi:hypothetical protein [Halarchaeum nitratireducens]|uniref:Uncharacterized protein n=1 Tax=Halarchaeum nitratireducens TaxID=489913 RepID=A0A830GD62_9EURY|nr:MULTISPECIES: hypothetical protein [Halarchaeum]MBP2250935.1 hypothetical protein [Halarchaeum solikamskense]GGN20039.1 hypothetical protein GCM10009021_21430 [Halarchaeum nitratireducens]
MVSARTLLALLVGLAILTQPVVGDPPGLDTQYTYGATPFGADDGEAVHSLYHLPAVGYGVDSQLTVVRQAANDTVTRPVDEVPPEVERLTEVRFLADDRGDQYYRLDARIDGETFTLNATPVSARAVAADLAVAPADAPAPIRDALDGNATSRQSYPAAVLRTDDGYALVRTVATERVPDPYTVPKIAAYGFAVALVVWGCLSVYRERVKRETRRQ